MHRQSPTLGLRAQKNPNLVHPDLKVLPTPVYSEIIQPSTLHAPQLADYLLEDPQGIPVSRTHNMPRALRVRI